MAKCCCATERCTERSTTQEERSLNTQEQGEAHGLLSKLKARWKTPWKALPIAWAQLPVSREIAKKAERQMRREDGRRRCSMPPCFIPCSSTLTMTAAFWATNSLLAGETETYLSPKPPSRAFTVGDGQPSCA